MMVFEVGILARLTIDAHSLSNEGAVGNVTEPRTVLLADGTPTDGISGEMLKHMHVRAFWNRATKEQLCQPCSRLSPMKASESPKVSEVIKEYAAKSKPRNRGTSQRKNVAKEERIESFNRILTEALQCAICDTHGFLIEDVALSRKSALEFGWALAVPKKMFRDIHTHSRVASGEKAQVPGEEQVAEQMVYHRPTRSGVYGFITLYQPWRIGLNEIRYEYVIEEEERLQRHGMVVDAYGDMLGRLEGAMTTTRLPHQAECAGVILTSTQRRPVALVSPLLEDYATRASEIASKRGFKATTFDSFTALLDGLDAVKKAEPLRI